ncbi:hypothetical protein, partial [Youhaiella tibetensis]|uniref:hypothetical protein n=1 Tax=Paradevosia tibetensis TaxID=1447062 RepID=UPI001AEEA1CE
MIGIEIPAGLAGRLVESEERRAIEGQSHAAQPHTAAAIGSKQVWSHGHARHLAPETQKPPLAWGLLNSIIVLSLVFLADLAATYSPAS